MLYDNHHWHHIDPLNPDDPDIKPPVVSYIVATYFRELIQGHDGMEYTYHCTDLFVHNAKAYAT